MTRQTLRRFLWALIAATSGLAGSAQAALVTGRFDPDFGGTLSGTNFSGTATFSISDACLNLALPSAGAFVYQSYNCGAGGSGMSFLGAHVDFSGALTGSLDFAADPTAGPNSILGMYVQGGKVIGVQSTIIGPASAELTPSGGGASVSYSFDIVFGMLNPVVGADEGHFPGKDGDSDLDDMPASDFQSTSLILAGASCPTGASCVSRSATTTYVPEPGSLALTFGALAAVAGVARRRRQS